jgi:8-amino-3,8-dideoxy-alpha-D-manno-octulosonate transaminase
MRAISFHWTMLGIGSLLVISVSPARGTSDEPPDFPKAFLDGTGPSWTALGEVDFVNVNCDPGTWSWKDGVIHCTGRPVGVLRTRKVLTNFELVAQWRHLRSGGNSGIFVWASPNALEGIKPGSLPRGGIEVQILDHGFREQYEKESGKKGDWFTTNGDVFAVGTSRMNPFPPVSPDGRCSFPSKNLSKGVGEWNHYSDRGRNGPMHRRTFLAAAAALAGSSSSSRALALEGGKRVRARPLRSTYYGPEYYDDKELAQLRDVLGKRQPFRFYGPGGQPPMKVLTFEQRLAERMHTRYALAVTSGTAALTTALAALGAGPGDEVILPAWSWYACFSSIVLNGALPVFAESDTSFNIDPADLESKITPQTKVIMLVHTLGNPADMDAISSIARDRRIKVLEDCAQSLGGSYKGKPLGSIGDIGIYSFQIAKTISSGEGGALVTNDSLLFERAARYHDLGLLRPPHQALLGRAELEAMIGNQYRMSEFTGAVLLAQLSKLDTIVAALRGHARRVYDGIADLPGLDLRARVDPAGDTGSTVWLGFPSQALRDKFLAAMNAENVPASSPLGVALVPLQPCAEHKLTFHSNWPSFASERGRSIRYGSECCPRTIAIHRRFAGITLDPKYSQSDVDDIVAAIRKVYPAIARA